LRTRGKRGLEVMADLVSMTIDLAGWRMLGCARRASCREGAYPRDSAVRWRVRSALRGFPLASRPCVWDALRRQRSATGSGARSKRRPPCERLGLRHSGRRKVCFAVYSAGPGLGLRVAMHFRFRLSVPRALLALNAMRRKLGDRREGWRHAQARRPPLLYDAALWQGQLPSTTPSHLLSVYAAITGRSI
jgi:hypothetical protein